MTPINLKTIASSIILAAGMLGSTVAFATPFSITAATFTPGSGYGKDANEATNVATLLDVAFSTSNFNAQNFSLNAVGNSITFNLGSITFAEPNGFMGIVANETNDLGVTATMTFALPGNSAQQVTATGTASTGSVSDNAVDFTLSWNSVIVPFGNGGSYSIALTPVSFRNVGTAQVDATITLLATEAATVPEPSTLALAGLAFAAMGAAGRRRARK